MADIGPSPRMTRYLNDEMDAQEAAEFEEHLIEHGTDDDMAWIAADTALRLALGGMEP